MSATPQQATPAPFRPLDFGVTRVSLRDGPTGTHYVLADQPLADFPARLTDRFAQWARTAPERTWIARRTPGVNGGPSGDWQHVSYGQAWEQARSIAQGLVARGLNVDRPVVILSENSIEHALMAMGCMLAGVPFVPTSPAYSLISTDYEKLRHVLRTVTPGVVFASDSARYGKAIRDNNIKAE